jgi:hypothetical protein
MHPLESQREETYELLSRTFADGTIDEAEYERRIALVRTAQSSGEIQDAVRDVRAADDQTIMSVLGSRTLRGDWLHGRHTTSVTLMASTSLDLRECTIPDETTIHVISIMGECRIDVPRDVEVINSVTPILAEVGDAGPATRSGRRIRLTGIAVMSELRIGRA